MESQPIEHIAERAFKYYREDQVLYSTALSYTVLYSIAMHGIVSCTSLHDTVHNHYFSYLSLSLFSFFRKSAH